jgi:hypothetical protein
MKEFLETAPCAPSGRQALAEDDQIMERGHKARCGTGEKLRCKQS